MMKKFIMLALLLTVHSAFPCTCIRLTAKDNTVVTARTLEFGANLIQTSIIIVPRNTAYIGTTKNNKPGLAWQSKYAFLGVNSFNYPHIMDGINEKGLYVGLFYFPGYAEYEQSDDSQSSMAPWELGTWILSNFSSLDHLQEQLATIHVVSVANPELGIVPPLHYIVTDRTGKSLVIEYVKGICIIHKNEIGVFTNSPTFDWHMTNLKNYINLSPINVAPLDLAGTVLTGFGQGTGFLGLPGDFTSPSRFIRATAFLKSAIHPSTAQEAIKDAFHILNSFDIPKGAVREIQKGGHHIYEQTQFTSAADLKNGIFYFHTYDNRQIRMVKINSIDPSGKEILKISMDQPEEILDITTHSKKFKK